MGFSIGKVAASLIPGVGPYLSGKEQQEAAKVQKEGAQEGAQFKYKETLEQAKFDYRTTRERTNTELQATLGQANLQRRQAKEGITVATAALDDQIGTAQGVSTLKQNEMARKARQSVSAARAASIESGVVFSGTSADVVQQAAVYARLDQLSADYESRAQIRGLYIDRAGLMLKGRQTDEATDFTVGTAVTAADLTNRQSQQARDLTLKYANEAKMLELKYAQIGYRTERNQIQTQTAVNIGAQIIGTATMGAVTYGQVTGKPLFS